MSEIQDANKELTINITNATISKLSLSPDDVLFVTLRSDDVDVRFLESFKKQIQSFFPNNKVGIIALAISDSIKMEVYSPKQEESVQEEVDCSQPASYCGDCGCGKKERIEAMNQNGEQK